ncbi:unnamed protein product [Calypogeia fissa]
MVEEGNLSGSSLEALGDGEGLSMADQRDEPLEKMFAMVSGDGEESYSKNSQVQRSIFSEVRQSALYEALDGVTLPSEGSHVVVADLGSSSSPNAVNDVVLIVENLRHRSPQNTEFQAFFNDLPANDFNTLFQHICNDARAKNVFASGVPGSFYGRLFPHSSVHVFHSSSSLHWLSEVPHAVLSQESTADGGGNPLIKYPRTLKEMQAPFKPQAALDLKNFLLSRAAELVSGGLLFMVFGGSFPPDHPGFSIVDTFWVYIHEVFSDLVAEGLLTQQQQDTFRIPIYYRGMEDLTEAVASCASLFSVLTAKFHKLENTIPDFLPNSKPSELPKNLTCIQKAVLNSLIEAHVGKELTKIIWQRYEKVVAKKLNNPQDLKIVVGIWIVSLICK